MHQINWEKSEKDTAAALLDADFSKVVLLLCHFFCVAFTADTFSLCQRLQLNAAQWHSKYVFTLKTLGH